MRKATHRMIDACQSPGAIIKDETYREVAASVFAAAAPSLPLRGSSDAMQPWGQLQSHFSENMVVANDCEWTHLTSQSIEFKLAAFDTEGGTPGDPPIWGQLALLTTGGIRVFLGRLLNGRLPKQALSYIQNQCSVMFLFDRGVEQNIVQGCRIWDAQAHHPPPEGKQKCALDEVWNITLGKCFMRQYQGKKSSELHHSVCRRDAWASLDPSRTDTADSALLQYAASDAVATLMIGLFQLTAGLEPFTVPVSKRRWKDYDVAYTHYRRHGGYSVPPVPPTSHTAQTPVTMTPEEVRHIIVSSTHFLHMKGE